MAISMVQSGIANISAEGLHIANEFAKGEPFFHGPSVESRVDGARRIYTCGKREFVIPSSLEFGSFLLEYLKSTLGKQWLRELGKSKSGKSHPLIRLFTHAHQYSLAVNMPAKAAGVTHMSQCGAQRELFTLADDMMTLELIDALPAEIVPRLHRRDGYQGVRYELAVAGAFARAGFLIEWLPSSSSNPEFVATHPTTGDILVVEAKSRHRAKAEQFVARAHQDAVAGIEADFSTLYSRAAAKPTGGLPLVICIDANVPYRAHESQPFLGLEGLVESLNRAPLARKDSPAAEFMLCITTCGWYYALHTPAFPVRMSYSFPMWTTATPRNFNTYVALLQAMRQLYTSSQSGDMPFKLDPRTASEIAFKTGVTRTPPPQSEATDSDRGG